MTAMSSNYSPTGPGALITFDSDEEESFVVLGKSLIPDDDYKSSEMIHHLDNHSIEEARKIIADELNGLNKSVTVQSLTEECKNPFADLNVSSKVNSLEKKSSLPQTSCSSTTIEKANVSSKMSPGKSLDFYSHVSSFTCYSNDQLLDNNEVDEKAKQNSNGSVLKTEEVSAFDWWSKQVHTINNVNN